MSPRMARNPERPSTSSSVIGVKRSSERANALGKVGPRGGKYTVAATISSPAPLTSRHDHFRTHLMAKPREHSSEDSHQNSERQSNHQHGQTQAAKVQELLMYCASDNQNERPENENTPEGQNTWNLVEIPDGLQTPRQKSGTPGQNHVGRSKKDSGSPAFGPGTAASPTRQKSAKEKTRKVQSPKIQ